MDDNCQGLCSGKAVYDMLYRAQGLDGPAAARRHVYVFASHAHLFAERAFEDQPEHARQPLRGWIVGTAGAEQYLPAPLRYGYLEVTVAGDGSVTATFIEVDRASPPMAAGPGATEITEFCFGANQKAPPQARSHGPCVCSTASNPPH
jgi:hypothetical protein